ncbi:MAG TPA: methylated-DNA--[protein]-cysteine S-methyltransferase [Verrucomicrobiae bacterium]|nr:methylated-DNA--[protein]-cysteine S-methyltransferase [Verrucomicrobiae bacterium]
MTSYTILKTDLLGDLLLVASPGELTGVYFHGRKHAPAPQEDWKLDPRHPVLKQAVAELQEYFAGERKTFYVPLHFGGTDFQHEIWRQIALIPFGETITYTELAERAGAPDAVRAAGTATGQNPLSIIVPCHRVVGKNGKLTGFAGGLDRKKGLLEIEMSPKHFRLEPACACC